MKPTTPSRLRRALAVKLPERKRAPSRPVPWARVMSLLHTGVKIEKLAKAVGGTERRARQCIDALRVKGHKVTNTSHRCFKLG